MLQHFLSKTEVAYLSESREFTKAQQRCIRYRLNKKLRLLGVSNFSESVSDLRDAASELRDGSENLLSRWSSLVRIPHEIGIIESDNNDKKNGGPDVIRTRDPRHVKAVS